MSFDERRRRSSTSGWTINGSIANNNRLGNGATVTGKHGSLLNTTHSNGGGTLKKHDLDNHQENHHHHLNVMPSVGGVQQLLTGTSGTDSQQNSASVCICNNKNGNGTMMEDNV